MKAYTPPFRTINKHMCIYIYPLPTIVSYHIYLFDRMCIGWRLLSHICNEKPCHFLSHILYNLKNYLRETILI